MGSSRSPPPPPTHPTLTLPPSVHYSVSPPPSVLSLPVDDAALVHFLPTVKLTLLHFSGVNISWCESVWILAAVAMSRQTTQAVVHCCLLVVNLLVFLLWRRWPPQGRRYTHSLQNSSCLFFGGGATKCHLFTDWNIFLFPKNDLLSSFGFFHFFHWAVGCRVCLEQQPGWCGRLPDRIIFAAASHWKVGCSSSSSSRKKYTFFP